MIARHLRRNKRKRKRDEMLARRRRRQRDFADQLLLHVVIILVACVFEWEDEYLSKLPRPIIPDLRFNLANCGITLTDGL